MPINSTIPDFSALNADAEIRAKSVPVTPMPSIGHLTRRDYQTVYEPSDDSFLLLDGLSVEFDRGLANLVKQNRNGRHILHASVENYSKADHVAENEEEEDVPRHEHGNVRTTLEIGCGTGVATIHLAKLLRREEASSRAQRIIHYVTDINGDALRVTQRTAEANCLPPRCVDGIQCDLASSLLPRLSGKVDVLIFNPPYVPTPDEEVSGCGIEASWAGGTNGRMVIDRALPQIADLLSRPHGVAYVITVDENFPDEMARAIENRYGMTMKPLLRRRARNEFLTVQKMTLLPPPKRANTVG